MADHDDQEPAAPAEPTSTDAPADEGPRDIGRCIRDEELFALMWAVQRDPPPAEEDPELARALGDLGEAYRKPLPVEFRLGPETAAGLLVHSETCTPCRNALLEDAPGARPPKTEAEKQAELVATEEQRRAQVKKFAVYVSVGTVGFFGAQYLFSEWRAKNWDGEQASEGALQRDPRDAQFQIDPLFAGGVVTVFIAAYFLAEAYVIARDLWFDFSAWKRAVPVIGKKWVEKDKKKQL